MTVHDRGCRWVCRRVVVQHLTRVRISLSLSRLKRFAKLAGVAEWCMFLVPTRDSELSTTIRLSPFHLNTFEHSFRISGLLYPVTPSLPRPKCDLRSGSVLIQQ